MRVFAVLDALGHALPVERIGTNEWRLSQRRAFTRSDIGGIGTRDTVVAENKVYAMCGTRLASDYALINGASVFGFPRGMRAVAPRVEREHFNVVTRSRRSISGPVRG